MKMLSIKKPFGKEDGKKYVRDVDLNRLRIEDPVRTYIANENGLTEIDGNEADDIRGQKLIEISEDDVKRIEENANNYTVQQLTNYYTKNQTDSRINIAKDEINLGVSSIYETKANVTTAINDVKKYSDTKKDEAITSANNTLKTTISNYYTKDETNTIINETIDDYTVVSTSGNTVTIVDVVNNSEMQSVKIDELAETTDLHAEHIIQIENTIQNINKDVATESDAEETFNNIFTI